RLRRGAVNLVRENHLMKNRTGLKMKRMALSVENRGADDIGRQEIAGELDALIVEAQQISERVRQGRLADPGDVLDQQMSSCQQAADRETDLVGLAEDDGVGGMDESV